jgi:uncharacterized membrane protein YphA (DoxX/SURF4 family)
MDVLTGVFQILASVIVVGGIAKIASPDGFASLLRTLGLPGPRWLSRTSGVAEVLLGCLALVVGGRISAVLVAAAYTVFTVVVVLARRSGAASCGCFGAVASPPSNVHVVVNAASALLALAAAVVGPLALTDSLSGQPLAAVPYLVTIATAVWLVVVLDTTGALLVDRMGDVARLGPSFRAHSARETPSRTTVPATAARSTRHRHGRS